MGENEDKAEAGDANWISMEEEPENDGVEDGEGNLDEEEEEPEEFMRLLRPKNNMHRQHSNATTEICLTFCSCFPELHHNPQHKLANIYPVLHSSRLPLPTSSK
jgi:hypothetical protein